MSTSEYLIWPYLKKDHDQYKYVWSHIIDIFNVFPHLHNKVKKPLMDEKKMVDKLNECILHTCGFKTGHIK